MKKRTNGRKKNQDLIKGIVKKLRDQYAPEKIILFGSYAYGKPRRDSDIDLLIVKNTSERFIDRWVTVRRILSDSKLLIGLDTLVVTPDELSERLAAGDQVIAEIVEKGKLLYAA
ncbi:MAG: nucleotidyltransferase domain-containing protein [Chloroflexi bacterium]|nr:nucleotidyltransferase domain-containing protein [Chloroflexota bacterium]MBI3742331.1 nucleotidyltransferase domain-containing protein [Chloroflexota bacterium]